VAQVLAQPLDALRALLPAGALVADLGCGPGRHLQELGRRGLRAVGVDLSAGMLAVARSRGQVVQGDLLALPLRTGSVDGVWSSYALLHLDGPGLAQAMAEAVRVLRPGGALGVVLASGSGSALEPVPYAPELSRWFHLHRLADLERICADLGLQVRLADVLPEAHRAPLRLVAVKP